MTRILLPLMAVTALLLSAQALSAEQTVSFEVEKMSCALCPVTVRKAMEGVEGVRRVDVDFESRTATVTFDDARTSVAAIAQASANAGYPARLSDR